MLDVRLDPTVAVQRIQARQITMAPGHPGGLHVHNGPVVGSVLQGSVIYQIEGDAASILGPGDIFFEPQGTRIARFDAGDDGATFLAFFPLTAGQDPELIFPDA